MRSMLNSVKYYLSRFHSEEELQKVIKAIKKVDRKYFVKENPYVDTALPIGHGATISQPSTVARMLLLADLSKEDKVLEVGAGSGWNAALIAYLVYPGKVLSLDIVPELLEKAKDNLKEFGETTEVNLNIEFRKENILHNYENWKEKYDRIIITAGISRSQEKLIESLAGNLLKDKGKLVCPYQSGPMIILTKEEGKIKKELTSERYSFVPLVG